MGRYYSGDIDGKFWFGVQSSKDPSFFGVEPCEPSELEYCFGVEHLSSVERGIEKCLAALGEHKFKLDEFFKRHNGYNHAMLAAHLEMSNDQVAVLLEWYARLELGEKIKDSLNKKGQCCFTAEL